MVVIATLATKQCFHDLKILFFTLQLWNKTPPTVYIYCDSEIERYIQTNPYKGKVIWRNILDIYTNYDRSVMEILPGIKDKTDSLFKDFVLEKTYLLDWVFETEQDIFFCDADICFLGPLPTITDTFELGLSQHNICKNDEERFGKYNAGFIFLRNKNIPTSWRNYSLTSRFFEQACLEDLEKDYSTFYFKEQVNYGWWRLLQGEDLPNILIKKWSIYRQEEYSGIYVNGFPLICIHTHWKTSDKATSYFNEFVLSFLNKLSSVKKTKLLINFLKKIVA